MTLAVFLLPHVINEPEVLEFVENKLTVPKDELLSKLRNGDDHKTVLSSEELRATVGFLYETVGIMKVVSVSWTYPVKGEIGIFSHKNRFFAVSEGDLIGPCDHFENFRLPLEAVDLDVHTDCDNEFSRRVIDHLLSHRNGERVVVNGAEKIRIDNRLLAVPDVSCCDDCPDESNCRHVFGIVDDTSSILFGGYLFDKQLSLGKILSNTFSSLGNGAVPNWERDGDRNSKLISRLFETYHKRNAGGLSGIMRNEQFFRLTRNLLEDTCKTILHPDESGLEEFDIQPVCFVSENVIEDFEKVKAALLSELGQDGDLDGPNEFGTIA